MTTSPSWSTRSTRSFWLEEAAPLSSAVTTCAPSRCREQARPRFRAVRSPLVLEGPMARARAHMHTHRVRRDAGRCKQGGMPWRHDARSSGPLYSRASRQSPG
eukprot:1786190-Prymnesium_polylepis.1